MEVDKQATSLSAQEEHALILAAKAGDQPSYESLERQYQPLLSAQVAHAMSTLPASLQEDCMQVARGAFHSAICHYEAARGVKFGHFAKVCIRNGICSYLRKQSSRLRREQNMGEEALLWHLSEDPNSMPSYRILEQENWLQWNATLSPFEREVLRHSFAGRKPREIAGLLEKPVKSVYNALVRIRVKRKQFE